MDLFIAVDNIMKSEKHFSGAMLLQVEGHCYAQGYSYANRSDQTPNTANTRFGIASGCKIFTAVAICQLVEEGKLTFDTRLKDCLSISFPHFDRDVTIHHLLTHTSGIPDYFDEELMNNFEELWLKVPMYTMQTPQHFVPLFSQGKMKFSPGERFAYNNAAYIVLGLVIEEITGQSFISYVKNHIFKRCGMLDSGYFRLDQLPEQTAIGYIDQDDSWRSNIYCLPVVGGPDGGAFSNVYDLAKFWDALFNYELLSREYTDILLRPHVRVDDTTMYGYGVWIKTVDDLIFKYYVMGYDPGVCMQSSYYPQNKWHVHILGNSEGIAGSIASQIDGILQAQ